MIRLMVTVTSGRYCHMFESFLRPKITSFLGTIKKQKSDSNKTKPQLTLRGLCSAFLECCFLDVFSLCEETSPGPQGNCEGPRDFFSLGTHKGTSLTSYY
ncbi:hypothetical protein TNCT_417551 [Trichonephila clavata]|uniref:Uncharacterized protein n=1 Tax=Trichonephila clavata TaxID=2740835 RepID=A0A8X6KWY7_TRICU|nr:hypothetical protein TNCT_417551 [Trichonephila clavata]